VIGGGFFLYDTGMVACGICRRFCIVVMMEWGLPPFEDGWQTVLLVLGNPLCSGLLV